MMIVSLPTAVDEKDIEQAVSDICFVLSVARGSKVTDVYREERDADGQLIARVHRSAVTKNLKGAEIHIRERTNDPDRTLSEARVE
jgi:hypothetical protein